MRFWAIKKLFVWRWRCGYWDFDAFKAAWNWKPHNTRINRTANAVPVE